MRTMIIGALILGSALAASPAVAAAQASAPAPVYPYPTFGGPLCPAQAPAGWQYVRSVQPPFGLPWDVYAKTNEDGSTSYREVMCRYR